MFDNGPQRNYLSLSQLNGVIQACVLEIGIPCLLYDASGELILSLLDKGKTTVISPTAHPDEITEICKEAACSALNGEAAIHHADNRCLTEIIRHQGHAQGVLVAWIGHLSVQPEIVSMWKRMMRITRHQIENLIDIHKEIDELSAEIIDNYRELGLIHSLSVQLAGLTNMDRAYHLILKQLSEIVNADAGCIFKFDAATSELRMVQGVPHITDNIALPPVRLGEGVIGEVAETGQSILIEDVEHPLWDVPQDFPFTPPLMCCALQIGKTLFGVMVVARESTERVFEAGDLKILESAALQSAAAMMNVSLFEELRQSNQDLQQEIARRMKAETQLRHETLHDTLTGLPNRALFLDRLEQAIERAKRRRDYLFAVLFLDVDRFKVVNDSLGHTIGDGLLIALARRLKRCLRPEDTVARLGGDEFTILLDGIRDINDTTNIVDRIHKQLASPFNLSGYEVFTSASIGIVVSGTDYSEPEDLMRDADMAMYRAKVNGSSCEVFDAEMHARALSRLQLETDLRRALERQEFLLYYQPIISLETGRIASFEALIRWQHPERGLVSPGAFMPVVEENGLIVPMDRWVLHEACRQISTWQQRYPENPDLAINVNFHAKQFMQPDFMRQLDQVLRETRMNPHRLNLEITERMLIEHTEATRTIFLELKARDVQLQMDDFGTGYSSLSYLRRFPIDTLKIDRSFAMNMEHDKENSEIIRTIVMLAQNLGMDVTVEGIETAEQLRQLKAMGCKRGQGYYFSRPVDAQAAEALIAADNRSEAEAGYTGVVPNTLSMTAGF